MKTFLILLMFSSASIFSQNKNFDIDLIVNEFLDVQEQFYDFIDIIGFKDECCEDSYIFSVMADYSLASAYLKQIDILAFIQFNFFIQQNDKDYFIKYKDQNIEQWIKSITMSQKSLRLHKNLISNLKLKGNIDRGINILDKAIAVLEKSKG